MDVQTDGVGSIEEAVDVGESKCIKGGWLAVGYVRWFCYRY